MAQIVESRGEEAVALQMLPLPVAQARRRRQYEARRRLFRSTLFCVFFIPLFAFAGLIAPFFCTFMSQSTRIIRWVDAALNFFLSALTVRYHLQKYGLHGFPPFEEKRPALEPGADCC